MDHFAVPDPFDWSVNQVAEALASSLDGVGSGFKSAQAFRDNDIDGVTLLTDINHQMLKEELGVNSIGKRSAILRQIQLFRERSTKYEVHRLRFGQGAELVVEANRPGAPKLSNPDSNHPSDTVPPGAEPAQPVKHRSKETTVTDASGRKRRKLVLAASDSNKTPTKSLVATSELHRQAVNNSLMVPTGANQFGLHVTTSRSIGSYQIRAKVPAEAIFYKPASKIFESAPDLESDDDEFVITSSNIPPGLRQGVSRLMQHYLRQPPIELPAFNAARVVAIVPFSQNLLPEGQDMLATIFTNSESRIWVAKRKVADVPELDSFDLSRKAILQSSFEEHGHEEGSLGYDDLDGEYDDETWAEIEAEKKEVIRQSNHLTLEQIDGVIDQSVAEYVKDWEERQLPRLKRKSAELWKSSRNNTASRIKAKDLELQRLEKRLEKICSGLREADYNNLLELRKMCRSLEASVYDHERVKFELPVIKSAFCPAQSPKKAHKFVPGSNETQAADVQPSDEHSEAEDVSPSDDDFIEQDEYEAYEDVAQSFDGDVSSDGDDETIAEAIPGSMALPIDLDGGPADATADDQLGPDTPAPELPESAMPLDLPKWDGKPVLEAFRTIPWVNPLADFVGDMSDIPACVYRKENPRDIALVKAMLPLKYAQILHVWELDGFEGAAFLAPLVAVGLVRLKYLVGISIDLDLLPASSILFDVCVFFMIWSSAGTHQQCTSLESFSELLNHALNNTHEVPLFWEVWNRIVCFCLRKKFDITRHAPRPLSRFLSIPKRSLTTNVFAALYLRQPRMRLLEGLERRKLSHEDAIGLVVNSAQPEITIHPHIGRFVKPHQLKGVRFFWRRLVDEGSGALLAHTMGLGKTMQVAAFLITVRLALASNNAQIQAQIPWKNPLKVLVICPASLLENWKEELLMWTPIEYPNILGKVRTLNDTKEADRRAAIDYWVAQGGVLIVGYEMFTRQMRQHDYFLDASIVIADEAHRLKNDQANVRKLVTKLKTRSRIGLTGSPLANNLDEYFNTIDWVVPNALGARGEFNNKYHYPIKAGLYVDSQKSERHAALRLLHELHLKISPQVLRAGYEVIKADLPHKVEFVITLPMSDLQREAYVLYMKDYLRDDGRVLKHLSERDSKSNVSQFDIFHMLRVLMGHPVQFRNEVRARLERKRNPALEVAGKPKKGRDAISENTMTALLEMFDRVPDIEDIKHSIRAVLALRIIQEAADAGERTLVFSQTLDILQFLEDNLPKFGFSTSKLVGATKVSDRQDHVSKFNHGAGGEVYLISTKAGGLGLNVHGATRVIIFDFGFNPVFEEQAIGRAYRLGQTKDVFVYRFWNGGTFEDRLYQTTIFKTQLATHVIDNKFVNAWAHKFNATEYMFFPKDINRKDVSSYKGSDPKVLDKILADDDHPIFDIMLTETFHKEDKNGLSADEKAGIEARYRREHGLTTRPENWPDQDGDLTNGSLPLHERLLTNNNENDQTQSPAVASDDGIPPRSAFDSYPDSIYISPGTEANDDGDDDDDDDDDDLMMIDPDTPLDSTEKDDNQSQTEPNFPFQLGRNPQSQNPAQYDCRQQ